MNYGIKSNIANLNKSSYAKEVELSGHISQYVDCSNGINPFGFSKEVEKALKNIPYDLVNTYAKSGMDVKLAIKDYWSDICEIDTGHIALGDGSIQLIYKINELFIDNRSKVFGYSPQFSDYIDNVRTMGGTYDYYLMDSNRDYKFEKQLFIEKMNKDHSLFYIDNPNNPTGQVIDIKSIEEIASKALELNRVIIIDEAYGDFIDKEGSAISLVSKFDNLIVLRTFSKGLGLAGIRGGYVVGSKEIIDYLVNISNPFEMNSIARYLSIAALKDEDFVKSSANKIRDNKERFIGSLEKLKVLETDLSIPIMTIIHPDKEVDLEDLLLKHNILSVSGEGFIGLGQNAVRIIITKDIESMILAFENVEKEML